MLKAHHFSKTTFSMFTRILSKLCCIRSTMIHLNFNNTKVPIFCTDAILHRKYGVIWIVKIVFKFLKIDMFVSQLAGHGYSNFCFVSLYVRFSIFIHPFLLSLYDCR